MSEMASPIRPWGYKQSSGLFLGCACLIYGNSKIEGLSLMYKSRLKTIILRQRWDRMKINLSPWSKENFWRAESELREKTHKRREYPANADNFGQINK